MNIEEINENDWDHLHDVVYNVTGKKSNREELVIIFESLSDKLKFMAYDYGMNDTVFRDKVFEYLQENKNEEISLVNEKKIMFTTWVVKMLNEGRICFSKRPNVIGEPDVDELDIFVEFAGGLESIGNDGSGTFSWRDLQIMADEQGLLK